jgi:glutathione S-transferase
VIEIDGERTADSTAILVRLDELFPEPPLLSSDPRTATQQRQLEDWADESFLWYFLKWRRSEQEREERRARGRGRQAAHWLRAVGAWLRAGGTWERPHTALLRQVDDRLLDLTNFLGTRPFFYADAPSMADLAVYSMLSMLRADVIPGSQRLMEQRPDLLDYMRRVEAKTGD